MPNYTTSYSTKKTMNLARSGRRGQASRGSRNGLGQLPRARQRSRKRPGASYLRHSQGFNAPRRRSGGGRSPRAVYALIIVGCALVVFAASIVWYANRGVDISLNGTKTSVRINSSIEDVISANKLDETCTAGNLLAVDDSVLKQGAGERYSVKLDGKRVPASKLAAKTVSGGEKLVIKNGRDRYEKHQVQATAIEPSISLKGTGAIQFVKTWGHAGRSEVWIGEESGKTKDRGVVKKVVNCRIDAESVSPAGNEKVLALTFDDAPSTATKQVLKVLADKGVQATFFMSGDTVESHKAAAKAIVKAGHEIGSNTYSDTDLTKLSGKDLRSQITRGFSAIKDATGSTATLMRAPSAQFSLKNWSQSADLMSAVVSWNLDSGDWMLAGADAAAENVASSVRTGNIILMTESDATSSQTPAAVAAVIDALQQKGYRITTVSKLIATDKNLSQDIGSLKKAGMPKGAVLPTYKDDADA